MGVGYEDRFRAGAALGHLDLELAERFLDRAPVREGTIEDALCRYGLIERHVREWRVTNAALLLFARCPALKWHPRAGVRVFRVWGRERRHGRNRNVVQVGRADPPVAHAIDEAARLAGAQVRPFERLDGLYFKRVQEYLGFVWREALVNAIAHRDYRIQARETEIWFYDDRFEAVSPGDLIAPGTADRLGREAQVHATRNPMLVRVLVEVGAMRARGQGIARIFAKMAQRHLPEPEIVCQDGLFTMKVFGEGARLS